jgi:hypothetical protein
MAIVVKINQILLAAVILGNVQLIAMDSKADICKKKLIKEEQELFKKERVLGEIINSLEDYRNQVNLINSKKDLMSELGYEVFGVQVMQGVKCYKILLDKQNQKCLASQKKVTVIRNKLAIFQRCADVLNDKNEQYELQRKNQRGKKRQLEVGKADFIAQKRRLMNDKSINTLL